MVIFIGITFSSCSQSNTDDTQTSDDSKDESEETSNEPSSETTETEKTIDYTPATDDVPAVSGYHDSAGLTKIFDSTNDYSVAEDGTVTISYRNGEITSEFPVKFMMSFDSENDTLPEDRVYESQSAFYITEALTAVSCYRYHEFKLIVYISVDMGKHWNTTEVSTKGVGNEFFPDMEVIAQNINFVSPDIGWLILHTEHGVGSGAHCVLKTVDGGKSWKMIEGNLNDFGRKGYYGGFSSEQIGFVCYRFEEAAYNPPVQMTKDGGVTWEILNLSDVIPDEYDEYYSKTAMTPVFTGSTGKLPIMMAKTLGAKLMIYLETDDYGITWKISEDEPIVISQ